MRNILWVMGLGALIWIGAHANAAIAPLMTAFRATGARASGYSLNDWVEVHGADHLSALATSLGQRVHVSEPLTKTTTVNYQKVTESRTVGGMTTQVIVERLSTGATFAVLDCTSAQGFAGLTAHEAEFESALKGLGILHTDINLEGNLPGHVTAVHQRVLVRRALAAIGASDVNGINASGYIAMSAHTPFIRSSDSLQGHPVNVQVAISYNSYRHATQVYVGTPLVTVTY